MREVKNPRWMIVWALLVVFILALTIACSDPDEDASYTPAPETVQEEVADDGEADYLRWVQSVVANAGFQATTLGESLQEVGQDPALLNDSNWRASVDSSIASFRLISQGIDDFEDVPDSMSFSYSGMRLAAGEINEFIKYFERGLDGDIDALDRSAYFLERAGSSMLEALDEAERQQP